MKSISISAPDEVFDQAITAICGQYNYPATIPDPGKPGQQMPNPVTAVEFAQSQLLRWVRENIEAYVVKKANAAVDAARIQVQQQLDATAASITVTVT